MTAKAYVLYEGTYIPAKEWAKIVRISPTRRRDIGLSRASRVQTLLPAKRLSSKKSAQQLKKEKGLLEMEVGVLRGSIDSIKGELQALKIENPYVTKVVNVKGVDVLAINTPHLRLCNYLASIRHGEVTHARRHPSFKGFIQDTINPDVVVNEPLEVHEIEVVKMNYTRPTRYIKYKGDHPDAKTFLWLVVTQWTARAFDEIVLIEIPMGKYD